MKLFYSYIFILLIFCFFLFFTLNLNTISPNSNTNNQDINYYFSSSNFTWPVPGNYRITSPFGPRKSPTGGASSNHSGIDIGVPQNTNIYSVLGGIVTYTRIQWCRRIHNYNKFK